MNEHDQQVPEGREHTNTPGNGADREDGRGHRDPRTLRDMPPASASPTKDAGGVASGWSPAKREVDQLHKEVERWKRLYQDEVGGLEAREQAAQEQVRALQREQQTLATQLDKERVGMSRLQKKLDEMERLINADTEEPLKQQVKLLLEAYSEMSGQYDTLIEQITALSDELESTREARAESQERADQCMKLMMKNLEQERQEADKARRDLTTLEKTYVELLRSYREMNDRLIRKH